MNTSDMARGLAARRRRITALCESCGREMAGIARKRYCSDACRMRASRQRRRNDGVGVPSMASRLAAIRSSIDDSRTADATAAEIVREARTERAAAL